MQELNFKQIETVNGGIVWSLPRLAMGGLGAVRMLSTHAYGFSRMDHSGSNAYFMANRHQFNSML